MGAVAKTSTANNGSRGGGQPAQQDGSGDSRKWSVRSVVAIQPEISTTVPSARSARGVPRSGQRSCVTLFAVLLAVMAGGMLRGDPGLRKACRVGIGKEGAVRWLM
jgi:hypothetical protein